MSYVRVSILGTFGSVEVWSINPVFDPTLEFPGGVNQTALDTACLAIANRTLPTAVRSSLSTSAARTGARVEVRDDVTDALIATSLQGSASPMVGTGTLIQSPQTASVYSIRTDTPGASGRGRLYWPAMGVTIDGSGKIPAAVQTTMLTDFKAYLMGIRSDLAAAFPTIGFDLAVRSKTTKTTPHAVRIQLGNVLDTQRRRRDTVPESYQVLAFP